MGDNVLAAVVVEVMPISVEVLPISDVVFEVLVEAGIVGCLLASSMIVVAVTSDGIPVEFCKKLVGSGMF